MTKIGDELAKQLAIIGHGLEEMSAAAQATALFWDAEEGAVLREAFLDFRDDAERLLLSLKETEIIEKKENGGNFVEQSDDESSCLDSTAIF